MRNVQVKTCSSKRRRQNKTSIDLLCFCGRSCKHCVVGGHLTRCCPKIQCKWNSKYIIGNIKITFVNEKHTHSFEMFASLIKEAPVLTLRDLVVFKKFTSMKLSDKQWVLHKTAFPMSLKPPVYCFEHVGGHLPCLQLLFDFGEDWCCLLDFQEVHFLIEGDFKTRFLEHTPSTTDFYPIPIAAGLHLTPTYVRGKVVLGILSREMYDLFISGVHRIGCWVAQKGLLFYSPKDYVMEAHLEDHQYPFDSDSGCDCCRSILGKQLRMQRIKMGRELYDSSVHVDCLLDQYGVDRMARFFDAPHDKQSACGRERSTRLQAVLAEILWRKRFSFLRGVAGTPFIGFHTEPTQAVLLDARLFGVSKASRRISSFFAGGIVTFL